MRDLPSRDEMVPGTFANDQGDIWLAPVPGYNKTCSALKWGTITVPPIVAIMAVRYGWSIIGVQDIGANLFIIQRHQGGRIHV